MAKIEKVKNPLARGIDLHEIFRDSNLIASWRSGPRVAKGEEHFHTYDERLTLYTCQTLSEEALQNSSLAD